MAEPREPVVVCPFGIEGAIAASQVPSVDHHPHDLDPEPSREVVVAATERCSPGGSLRT